MKPLVSAVQLFALMILLALILSAVGCQSTAVHSLTVTSPGRPPCELVCETSETTEAETAETAEPQTAAQSVTICIGNNKIVATSAADAGDGKRNLWSWLTALAAGGALGALAAP